jgi:hypothetical protein
MDVLWKNLVYSVRMLLHRIVYRVSDAIYILTIFRSSRMFPSDLE